MFGSEFGPKTEATQVFGLRTGQMRHPDTIHNGGWYNARGEKLGWGDLNVADYTRIQAQLEEDDVFVVLTEQDSFWNFVTKLGGTLGCLHETNAEMYAPGIAYVKEHVFLLITRERAAYVGDAGDPSRPGQFSREEAEALIDRAAQHLN